MKKIYVLCPGNSLTGGPELIHQFIDSINNIGGDASIIYYPLNENFLIPEAYKKYNVKIAKYDDVASENTTIIVPEISTSLIRFFKKSDVYVWWMSVDNYFKCFPNTFLGRAKQFIKKIIQHKNLPIDVQNMKKYHHLVQSYYAKDFLQGYDIESNYLSDYLNERHLNQQIELNKKKNIICYNPKKGYQLTSQLMRAFPEISFKPIENMTADQVASLLSESKIYIDFGNHPGKDRIPREAAMASCIVITGTKGSAKNEFDIPVPKKYKVDETSSSYINIAGGVFNEVFSDYDKCLSDFFPYRQKIKNEKKIFLEQVSLFMLKNNSDNKDRTL